MEQSEVFIKDIIKKFDLPERKSKINTILKMQEGAPVYCLCQSTDISRFMICCEKCDEWFHGDCIGMAEKDAKYIKKWYCSSCISIYGLEVVYFPSSKTDSSKNKKEHKQKHSFDQDFSTSGESRCGKCSNCLQNEDCGNKDYRNLEKRPKYEGQSTYTATSETINYAHTSSACKKVNNGHGKKYSRYWKVKNCIGPDCRKAARQTSKYCSDDCGLALARLRILSILPINLIERAKIPCVADNLDRAKLENVRAQIKFSTKVLKKLDFKEKELSELIAKVKSLPVVETEEEIDDESRMYCVTCGLEISTRTAVRHMEICFKKVEGRTAFAGPLRSNTEYSKIFCDFYDTTTKTYCKRLRYVCPDHYKPKKVKDNEVCGCPIVNTVTTNFVSGCEKYCQQSKKKCDQHYNWELMSMSEIDVERFREWSKLSQLLEEEEILRRQLTNRTGVLGVLLHSTTVEEL